MTKDELSKGIINRAHTKAEEIITLAEKSSKTKLENSEKRFKRQLNDAKVKSQKATDVIYIKQQKLTSMYINRYNLKDSEDFIEKIIIKVSKKIDDIKKSTKYKEALENLILEGALGLNRPRMYLNASRDELNLLSPDSLIQISNKASEILEDGVEILFSDDTPLTTMGIVLKSEDGGVSYNNLIKTRIKRKQDSLRELIAKSLDTVKKI